MMSFMNVLKSSGAANDNFSPAKNQYGDVERIFQGYPPNPYLVPQQSDGYDNVYHPGYMSPNHGYGLKFGSSGPGYGGHSYGTQHHQSPHGGGYGEVHSYGGGHSYDHGNSQPRHKSKVNTSAMSALTLLAFLFFLNILQSCLKEHMMTMNPTVMIMTAGASRLATNQRTVSNDGDAEAKKSESTDYKIFSPNEDVEIEIEPEFTESENPFRKYFNESNVKSQNANNFYRRRPHRA